MLEKDSFVKDPIRIRVGGVIFPRGQDASRIGNIGDLFVRFFTELSYVLGVEIGG